MQVGVHPHGPWWGGETGSPLERLEHGFTAYYATYQTPLDIVTFSSNLWDLQRWSVYNEEALNGGLIREDLLLEWAAHLLDSLSFIEVRSLSSVAINRAPFSIS